MRTMLILAAALAVTVMCMASKCTIGDSTKTLPQKAQVEVLK